MGIQKLEADILGKAKRDQKKIEDYKRRFREAMALGNSPITNQLRNYSEIKIKNVIDKLEERIP